MLVVLSRSNRHIHSSIVRYFFSLWRRQCHHLPSVAWKKDEHPIFKLTWNSSTRLKHKIFFWLLLHDTYALCSDKIEETIPHLFWNCPFTWLCWSSIIPNRNIGISTFDEVHLLKDRLPPDIAMEIIIMGCWSTWMIRNDKIFKRAPPHQTHGNSTLKKDSRLPGLKQSRQKQNRSALG